MNGGNDKNELMAHLTIVTVDGEDLSRTTYHVSHETKENAAALSEYLTSLPRDDYVLLGFLTVAFVMGFDDLSIMNDRILAPIMERGGYSFVGRWSKQRMTATGALRSKPDGSKGMTTRQAKKIRYSFPFIPEMEKKVILIFSEKVDCSYFTTIFKPRILLIFEIIC
jgi:hypothetical protein